MLTEEEVRPARVAILDMYDRAPNLGMDSLRNMLKKFGDQIEWDEFEVRSRRELPGIEYDLYVSTGGPGSPLLAGHGWELGYRELLDRLWTHNQNPLNRPKPVFFICHSFQMLCQHFGLGTASLRRSPSPPCGTPRPHMGGRYARLASGAARLRCIRTLRCQNTGHRTHA